MRNDGFFIFVIFFGLALLEAVRNRSWVSAIFWIAIGIAFVRMGTDHTPHHG